MRSAGAQDAERDGNHDSDARRHGDEKNVFTGQFGYVTQYSFENQRIQLNSLTLPSYVSCDQCAPYTAGAGRKARVSVPWLKIRCYWGLPLDPIRIVRFSISPLFDGPC